MSTRTCMGWVTVASLMLMVGFGCTTSSVGGEAGPLEAVLTLTNPDTITVEAGEAAAQRWLINMDLEDGEIAGGTVELDLNAITVTAQADGNGNKSIAAQAMDPLEITFWVGPSADVNTVCEDGEQYGPFEIQLDENYQPVSVTPSTVTLTEGTLALLGEQQIALCMRVVSPVSGTVRIEQLILTLD